MRWGWGGWAYDASGLYTANEGCYEDVRFFKSHSYLTGVNAPELSVRLLLDFGVHFYPF